MVRTENSVMLSRDEYKALTNDKAVEILTRLTAQENIPFLIFSQRLAIGMAINALKEQQALREENQRLKEQQFQYGRF